MVKVDKRIAKNLINSMTEMEFYVPPKALLGYFGTATSEG